MRRLLNFGVADPLTLGMAHPVADRLETLGRARPATWRSHALALSAMSVIALASAPLSIAANEAHPETEKKYETRYKFSSSLNGKKGQSYEIVTENGVKKAYQILEEGKRKQVDLVKKEDGSYRMTFDDGQTINLPNIDRDNLERLRELKALESLEGLEGLEALKGLKSLEGLDALEGVEFSDADIKVFSLEESDFTFLDGSKFLDKFPNDVRDRFKSKDLPRRIEVIRNGTGAKFLSLKDADGKIVELDDTVVGTRVEFFQTSDPLGAARRQLERTKRQLENLSENESLTFDLENALRDIESAQKSLKEAESRLLDEE